MSNLQSLSSGNQVATGSAQTIVRELGSFVPVRHLTFEGGTIGALAKGKNSYDNTLGPSGSVFSDKYAGSSGRSCHVEMLPPPTQAQQGGIINLSKDITGEFYIRCIAYVPTGFNFIKGNTQGQKFLRCNFRVNGTKTSGGYWNYYLDDQGTHVNAYEKSIKDMYYGAGGPCDLNAGKACRKLGTVIYGQRNNFEMYIRYRTDNTGIIRAWVNGILEYEVLNFKTKLNSNDGVYQIQVFSGPQPHVYDTGQSQGVYINSVTIADGSNELPSTDAEGNKFIGNWGT